MERSMRLVSRSSIRRLGRIISRVLNSVGRDRQAGRLSYGNASATAALIALFAGGAWGQLPDGPGKVETEKVCSQCHELARSISLRQDRAGWETTVNKMVGMGATASDAELKSITDYLAAHYAAEEVPRINVNKARAIDLESGLSLRTVRIGGDNRVPNEARAVQIHRGLEEGS